MQACNKTLTCIVRNCRRDVTPFRPQSGLCPKMITRNRESNYSLAASRVVWRDMLMMGHVTGGRQSQMICQKDAIDTFVTMFVT